MVEAEACRTCWREGIGTTAAAERWWSSRGQVNGQPCDDCGGTGVAELMEQRWADPESADGRAEFSQSWDMPSAPAFKAVLPGIQAVAERLVVQADGRPRLTVSAACPRLIEEVQSYRWRPQRGAEPKQAQPLKVDDHAMDALRYLVMGLRRCGY